MMEGEKCGADSSKERERGCTGLGERERGDQAKEVSAGGHVRDESVTLLHGAFVD